MAGMSDHQKSLLTLIRDFASEKSQGERRVVGLKNQIEELRSELEALNVQIEDAKRIKETTEQELKGYEVELSLNKASIQSLEARISLIHNEIAKVGSEMEAVKNEDGALRDQFLSQMVEINQKIRNFQETFASNIDEKNCVGSAAEAQLEPVEGEATEDDLRTLEHKLADLIAQTTKVEEEYQAEKNMQIQIQKELADEEKKVSLMETIVKTTEELHDLTKQSSEREQTFTFLSEELQKRCICPKCHLDNVGTLEGILQADEANATNS